jgi:hypothetical protein
VNTALFLLKCLCTLLLMTATACAEWQSSYTPIRDKWTGVLLNPPKGWRIGEAWTVGSPYGRYEIRREPTDVQAEPGSPAWEKAWLLASRCHVTITPIPRYEDEQENQQYIGKFRDPAFLDQIKQKWAERGELVSAERFTRGSIVEVRIVVDVKDDVHFMRAYLASHRNVVEIYCGESQSMFNKRQPPYDAVVQGVAFPE